MNTSVRKLTHSALMIGLAYVLSMFKILDLPYGGAITIASMGPIILLSLMYDAKWGLITAFAYSLLQIIQGFSAPPVQSVGNFLLVLFLDYILAFTCLGLAGFIARKFKEKKVFGAVIATISVIFIRFLCSFASGVLIWSVYAPEGVGAVLYSFIYNGSIMLGEAIITSIAVGVLVRFINFEKIAAGQH